MPPSRVRIPPSPLRRAERCPSGLRSATGNRVRAERCVAGSNPALSASFEVLAGLREPARADSRSRSHLPFGNAEAGEQVVHPDAVALVRTVGSGRVRLTA